MSPINSDSRIEELPGEDRGIPSVNNSRSSTAQRGLMMIFTFVALSVGVGIGYWKYQNNIKGANQVAAQKMLPLTSAVPARTFVDIPTAVVLPSSSLSPPPPFVPTTPVLINTVPPLPDQTHTAAAPHKKPLQRLDKSGSSLMAVAIGAKPNVVRDDVRTPNPERQEGEIAERLSGTSTPLHRAERLKDRNFILAKGSFIDCALQTRLDSTVPGMTACVVTRHIYSDNGKVLLIERGSTLSGEYRSDLRQGMARLFVLWTRLKTPNGIIINLDSPGTDPLGGAGVPGEIDTHFWQRFGGALMLSLVEDVANSLSTRLAKNNESGTQLNLNSTQETTQNMATETLKNTINIPPTLYKNQGEQVGIYIARDLDFSSVYDVSIP